MLMDHPLGVGLGRFHAVIGEYDKRLAGRDAHNTFVRCACELGFPGLIVLIVILAKSYACALRARAAANMGRAGAAVAFDALAVMVALTIYTVSGMTSTTLYVEGMWWLVGLSICLDRIVGNLKRTTSVGQTKPTSSRGPKSLPAPAVPPR